MYTKEAANTPGTVGWITYEIYCPNGCLICTVLGETQADGLLSHLNG